MDINETELKGCFILKPKMLRDERGYFYESFNENFFSRMIGTQIHFVQDNQSYSTKGVVRGLHAQLGQFAQAKLVRVVAGRVLDVAVDVRFGSSTFGKHIAVELSSENNVQLFIPRGFLHGFVVLSDSATFIYKCDNYYNKESECGINPLDNTLGIDWLFSKESLRLSEKDRGAPCFQDIFI